MDGKIQMWANGGLGSLLSYCLTEYKTGTKTSTRWDGLLYISRVHLGFSLTVEVEGRENSSAAKD